MANVESTLLYAGNFTVRAYTVLMYLYAHIYISPIPIRQSRTHATHLHVRQFHIFQIFRLLRVDGSCTLSYAVGGQE